jgi:murein DD-endopeptidase MepM/ murein hydrolase activator NlpD
MFIPHSEKRVMNLQINSFTLVFMILIVGGIVGGFFYLATVFTGSERLIEDTNSQLQVAEASLEEVREQLGELFQVYDIFEQTLESTLTRLDIAQAGEGAQAGASGDLATMLDLQEVQDGELREMLDLRRIIASLESAIGPLTEISDVVEVHRQLLSDIPNRWPVTNGLGWVTMEFGPNVHPIYNIWYMHKGIDIYYYPGTPIVAAANGKVAEVAVDPGYGIFVEIDHNYGFRTRYSHLMGAEVQEGQDVVQGQRIGTMGSSGLSTGTHLDFQIRIGTEVIDPAHFLKLSTPDFARHTEIRG